MTRSALIFLFFIPTLSAVAQEHPIPRLGAHQFVPATSIAEPFITTDVQTSGSIGQTVNSSLPVLSHRPQVACRRREIARTTGANSAGSPLVL